MFVDSDRCLAEALAKLNALDTYTQNAFADMFKRAVQEEIMRSGAAPVSVVEDVDFNRVVDFITRAYREGKGR